MSDFKIMVDAEVDISKIKTQLSEKMKNITITPKLDGRSITTSLRGTASNIANTINKELKNKITDIKFEADTGNIEQAIKRIKAEMSGITSKFAAGSIGSTDSSKYQKYYSQLSALLKKYEAQQVKVAKAQKSTGDSASRLSSELTALKKVLASLENSVKITFNLGGQENVEGALEKVKSNIVKIKELMAGMEGQAGFKTDSRYLEMQKFYNKMLVAEKTYTNKLITISGETTDKIIKDIVRATKTGELTSEQAQEIMSANIMEYAEDYNKAMTLMKAGMPYEDLSAQLKNAVVQTNKLTAADNQLKQAQDKAAISAGDFTKILSQFVSLRFIVYAVWQAFKDGLTTLKEIDDTLIGIRKVTNMTAQEAQALAKNASNLVSEFGRSVQDYLSAYETFAKAGFAENQIKNFSKLSLLLQNVGDVEAEIANQTLIAANAGFKMNGSYEELSHTIDAMNNISNNNATTVAKMSEAIKVSATVAQVAGFSFDEYMSLVGAATTATQREGSEIGRALRTIVANIRQVTDAEAEVDEDTFGKAGKTLQDIAGIDLKDTNGQLRDTMDVLTELAGKWDTLDTLQQSQLANDIANKRQMDIFLGLMENWTTVEKQLGEAINSTGSALEENAVYLDSISAKTNSFNNEVTKMWQNTISSDAIKGFVDLGTNIIKIIDKVGLANIALVAFAGTAFKSGTLLNKGFVSLGKSISETFSSVVSLFKYLTASKAPTTLANGLKVVRAEAQLTSAAMQSLISIGVTVAVAGLMALATAYDKNIKTMQELSSAINESSQEIINNREVVDTALNTYTELIKKQDKTSSEITSLDSAILTLNKSFMANQVEIDGTVVRLNNYTEQVDLASSAVSQLNEEQARLFKAENVDDFNKAVEYSNMSYSEYLKETRTFWNGVLNNVSQGSIDLKQEIADLEVENIAKQFNSVYDSTLDMTDQFRILKSVIGDAEKGNILISDKDLKVLYKRYAELNNILAPMAGIISDWNSASVVLNKTASEDLNLTIKQERALLKKIEAQEKLLSEQKKLLLTQEQYNTELKTLEEVSNTASGNINVLAEAYYTLSQGEKLGTDQILKLIDAFPSLLQYYNNTTGALNVNKEALDQLIFAQIKSAEAAANFASSQLLNSKLAATGALTAYEKQIQGLKALTSAEVESAAASAGRAAFEEARATGLNEQQAIGYANSMAKAARKELDFYSQAVAQVQKLRIEANAIKTTGSTTTKKESSAESAANKAEKAWKEANERISKSLEQIRNNIDYAFDSGSINAKEALARITVEINSIKATYDSIKNKAEDTWTAMESALVEHYEEMLGMQDDYKNKVQQDYDNAVSNVQSLQAKIVSALTAMHEEERDSALQAIEAERELSNAAFKEKLDNLEAEKRALQDTRAEDEANLETLKLKAELAKLDTSVFGKKRAAELAAQAEELETKLKIADIDAEIESTQTAQDANGTYYEQRIEATNTMYDEMLKDANIYAEANKTILEGNVQEIIDLFETYAPDFTDIGLLFGKSLADGIKKEVSSALNNIGVINAGTAPTATDYVAQSTGISGGTTAPSGAIAWDGKVYRRGSTGEAVKRIQNNLISQGYSLGSADGIFGYNTQKAVTDFQKKNGLTADGIVGKNTWGELIKFNTGGIPVMKTLASAGSGTSGLVVAEDKERILSEKQTNSFDNFIYNILPNFTKALDRLDKTKQTTYQGELVKIYMDVTNNTPFDIENNNDNLVRMFKRALTSMGIKL